MSVRAGPVPMKKKVDDDAWLSPGDRGNRSHLVQVYYVAGNSQKPFLWRWSAASATYFRDFEFSPCNCFPISVNDVVVQRITLESFGGGFQF